MKSKEEKEKWLIQNCIDEQGIIDISGLDLKGYTVNFSEIKADTIYQSHQNADTIFQSRQNANTITQHGHNVKEILAFDLMGFKKEHSFGYYVKKRNILDLFFDKPSKNK